jgi:fibronectin-binding autotransporter adhesin
MTTEERRDDRRRLRFLTTRAGAALAAVAVACFALASASESSAATLQVCPSGCTYSQIASAVAAAQSGDTITVAAGTYQGGFTINTSLTLAGAGAGATIISGGGPVVTIGSGDGTSKLVVSITGVTITGGITHSSPQSVGLYGKAGVIAAGGGVEIAPDNIKHGSAGSPGATVTIANSVITRNGVAPTTLIPSPSRATCPGGVCKFAAAYGGGIDNAGRLTLTHTTISDNSSVSSFASDAGGGGIENEMGSLTIIDSTLTANKTGVVPPNGRFSDGGAIYVDKGALTIRGSSVTHNSATATTAWPDSVGTGAIGGAMHVSGSSATISNTTISNNSVTQTNTGGDANADSGALHTDVNVTLSGDVFADNHVRAVSLGQSSADTDGNSGAGQLLAATITNTRFTGNTVTVSSANGPASAEAGSLDFGPGSISNSVIDGNHVSGTSPHGTVSAMGGGIEATQAPMTLRNTPVIGNTVKATGRSGTAQGGGIADVTVPNNGPPGGPLTLEGSKVTDNTVSAGGEVKAKGGGVFTTFKFDVTDSPISGNTPNDCVGSGC